MNPIKFLVTDEFLETYESADGSTRDHVDAVLRQLLIAHSTRWARQGRVVGPTNEAWIATLRERTRDVSVYWDYEGSESIVLIALRVRWP